MDATSFAGATKARTRGGLPDPLIVSGPRRWLLLASFALDPVGALNRHFDPRLEAVEIKRSSNNPRRIMFIHGPEYNREYLLQSKRFRTSGLWPVRANPGTAQSNLRNHPLKTHGEEHADFDRLIDPYFNRREIERRFELIRRLTVEEVERWTPGVHDFYELARRCTGRVAFTILFGEQQGHKFDEFGELLHGYHRANWSSAQVMRFDLPGMPYHATLSRARAVQDYLFSWMRTPGGDGSQSLLERMSATPRSNGCPYSPDATASTVALVSWLAFETTATVLSWTVFLLAQHPAVLSDLIDELSAHDASSANDSAGLMALPLLDAVVKEAMRLITPVPVISFRMGTEGEIAGQHFGENSRFYVLPFMTHRMPDLYVEPDRFRPERWFSVKPSAYEFLPFGGGQRRCPGYWLATANLKVVLNEMLRRFRPSSPAGARVDRKYAVVLMPKAGVPIELVPKDIYDPPKIVPPASGSIFDLFVPEPHRAVRH